MLSYIQGMGPEDHTSASYVHGIITLFYVRLPRWIQSCGIFLEKEGPHISLSSPFPQLLLYSPPLHWNLLQGGHFLETVILKGQGPEKRDGGEETQPHERSGRCYLCFQQ